MSIKDYSAEKLIEAFERGIKVCSRIGEFSEGTKEEIIRRLKLLGAWEEQEKLAIEEDPEFQGWDKENNSEG